MATKDLAKDNVEDEAVVDDLTEQVGHEETHQNEDEFVAPTADRVKDEVVIEEDAIEDLTEQASHVETHQDEDVTIEDLTEQAGHMETPR